MQKQNILISILGTGQSALLNAEQGTLSYRTAKYALDPNLEQTCETPHVAEAILNLEDPGHFDGVIFIGTKNSMWDTLYAHCASKMEIGSEGTETWQSLENAVRSGRVSQADLAMVGAAFSQVTGIPSSCVRIPVGKSETEFWDIFETIAKLPQEGQTVHLDFTHGLRYQPFFLFLALQYLRVLRPSIQLGKVYYGAFELSRSHFQGITPIFDLKPMVELMDWMQAAFSFREYGDLRGLVEMIESVDLPQGVLFSARKFVQTLSLSVLDPKPLRYAAIAFKGALQKALAEDKAELRPLQHASPALLDLPNSIIKTQKPWEIQLVMARQLSDIEGQLGMAVLSCWEALINRLGEVYQKPSSIPENYRKLSRISRSKKARRLNGIFVDFAFHNRNLHSIRNAIAHNKIQKDIPIEEVPVVFRECLAFLESILQSRRMEELPFLLRF